MYKIVLIDDEPWALAGLRKIFNWHNKQFEIAAESTNSVEALDIIRRVQPDAVFTDIRMPDISGIELMKIIRSEGLDIEFVIISGFAEFSYAQESLRLGAFDYFLKPIQIKEANTLLKTLWEYLEQKKQKNTNVPDNLPAHKTGDYINPDFIRLLSYIDMHFQEELHLSSLAEKFRLNPTYCSELFKKVTEKTYPEYLSKLRIKHACRLLESTSMSLQQVAYKTGFSDNYYFTKVFKKTIGCPPSEFRKRKMTGIQNET